MITGGNLYFDICRHCQGLIIFHCELPLKEIILPPLLCRMCSLGGGGLEKQGYIIPKIYCSVHTQVFLFFVFFKPSSTLWCGDPFTLRSPNRINH